MVLALLVLFYAPAHAQRLQPGQWRTYSSMRNVQDVALSADSNSVWAATAGGAFKARLDGDSASLLALRNTEGLSDDSISSIAADPNGNVYLGGFAGTLDIYTESTGNVLRRNDIAIKDALTIKTIGAMRIVGDRVYLCTGYGLTVFNRRTGQFAETVTKFASLPAQEAVHGILEYGGQTYAVLPDSVARISSTNLSGAWSTVRGTNGFLTSIAEFHGQVYVGSSGGLFVLDNVSGAFKTITLPQKVSVGSLGVGPLNDSLFLLDSAGTTLLATADLIRFLVRPAPTLSAVNHLTQFAFGRGETKVYGTSNAGIAIEQPTQPFVANVFPPGPVSNNTADLCFSPATGKLYVAHYTNGVSIFSSGTGNWHGIASTDNILPTQYYWRVFYDSVRRVTWLSTHGSGLYKVAGIDLPSPVVTQYLQPQIPQTLPGGYTTTGHGMLDNQGNFVMTSWAFSGQGVVSTSDGVNFTPLAALDGSHSYGVAAEDPDGNFWVGTENNSSPTPVGVYGIRAQQFGGGTALIPGGTGSLLPRPEVNALLVDQDDGLWCGTNGGLEIISNISAFDADVAPTFEGREVPILKQQVIHSIVVDGVNNKWVGTENGVFVVSQDGSDSIAHFTTANSPLVSNSVISIALDVVNGEAYLGTQTGISRVSTIYKQGNQDFSNIHVYPNPVVQSNVEMPKVYITGLVGASTVSIYTISGRLVKTIDGSTLGATVTWDGLEETGRRLSSGVYIVSATSAQVSDRGQTKFVLVHQP